MSRKTEKKSLAIMALISLGLVPFLFRKPPIKDWLLVFLFNAFSNGIIDNILVEKKILSYPVRFLPKLFKIHVIFDYLIYPTFTVIFNQLTRRDKPMKILAKLLVIITPLVIIETIAEKKTRLLKWQRGWKWHHTFIYVAFHSLSTRLLVGIVRAINKEQQKVGV